MFTQKHVTLLRNMKLNLLFVQLAGKVALFQRQIKMNFIELKHIFKHFEHELHIIYFLQFFLKISNYHK